MAQWIGTHGLDLRNGLTEDIYIKNPIESKIIYIFIYHLASCIFRQHIKRPVHKDT